MAWALRSPARTRSVISDRSNSAMAPINWRYQPDEPRSYISHEAMPVEINLWLFQGQPPRNGQQVELVVRSFRFTPAPEAKANQQTGK